MFSPVLWALLAAYLPLVGWIGLGSLGTRLVPKAMVDQLGKLLFWVAGPLTVLGFSRGTDLSGPLWAASIYAWVGMATAAVFAWLWTRQWQPAQRGSFLLAAMFGNTGCIGFPVTLALLGKEGLRWALFYDQLGTIIGAYGLGIFLVSRSTNITVWKSLGRVLRNPILWAFVVGLITHDWPAPAWLDRSLEVGAWTAIALTLVQIGLRIGQVRSWQVVWRVLPALGIKLVLVPFGIWLFARSLPEVAYSAVVLQSAMPPAFAALVLAEEFDLDREMAVAAIVTGILALGLTLPVWVLLTG